MSYRNELRAALTDRLLSNVFLHYGATIPVKLENAKFDPPTTPYLSVYMFFTSGTPSSIGTTRKTSRHSGYFNVECLVPEDTGTNAMWRLSVAVERSLPRQNFTLAGGANVTIGVAEAMRNVHQDGTYYITVMIPFTVDMCE